MAGDYRNINKQRSDTSLFLTAGALPEMQNAQADAKDNRMALASEGLGVVNKRLYEFIAQSLQTTLGNIVDSGSIEFRKLSRQIYANIVDIVEQKSTDGEIAQAMIDKLDVFKESQNSEESTEAVKNQEKTTTTEVEGKTTTKEEPIQEIVTTVPVNVPQITNNLETVVTQTQEHIQPSKKVIHEPTVEKHTEVHELFKKETGVGEKYQQDVDAAIKEANSRGEELDELRRKIRLALVYLRSQKVEIFKILAGAQEDGTEAIVEKQQEIDLDYEEEMRERKNRRKEFDKRMVVESEWYKKLFDILSAPEPQLPEHSQESKETVVEAPHVEDKGSTVSNLGKEYSSPLLSRESKKYPPEEPFKGEAKSGKAPSRLSRAISPNSTISKTTLRLGSGGSFKGSKTKNNPSLVSHVVEKVKKFIGRNNKKVVVKVQVTSIPEKSKNLKAKSTKSASLRERLLQGVGKAKQTQVVGVAKKAWNFTKLASRKVIDTGKRVLKKAWNTAKKVLKKAWGSAKKIAVSAYKAGKKLVSTVYNVTTKLVVTAVKGIGTALKAAGRAVVAIPFVGPILGSILMGIGTGLTAASNALRVAFKTIGNVTARIVSSIEKALKVASKVSKRISRGKKQFSLFTSHLKTNASNFGIGNYVQGIIKAIKSWTTKWYFGAYKRLVARYADSLKFKLPRIGFKFKPKFGSEAVKKESASVIRGIFDQTLSLVGSVLQSGFAWVQNILRSLGEALSGILASIGMRLGSIGKVGFKGFIALLFSPTVLIPLGIALLVIFRKKVFDWLVNTVQGIWGFLKTAVSWIFDRAAGLWKWFSRQFQEGGFFKWLWDQTDPKNPGGIGYIAINFIFPIIKWLKKIKNMMIDAAGGPAGSAFEIGAFVAGWPWFLIGKMLYTAIKNMVKWAIENIWKRMIKGFIDVAFFHPFLLAVEKAIDFMFDWSLKGWLYKLFGIRGVNNSSSSGSYQKEVKDLEEAMRETEDAGNVVDKMLATHDIKHVNPQFKAAGLPQLKTFHNQVLSINKKNNDAINDFNVFLKESSKYLMDAEKAPLTSPGFYASEAVTRALLSVFFFTDPLSGNVFSVIPQSNIPSVLDKITSTVMEAKEDPDKLAKANTQVLTYFDYLNRGRSAVLGSIVEKYNVFMAQLEANQGNAEKLSQISKSFAQSVKDGTNVQQALTEFTSDQVAQVADNDYLSDRQRMGNKTKAFKGGNVDNATGIIAAGLGDSEKALANYTPEQARKPVNLDAFKVSKESLKYTPQKKITPENQHSLAAYKQKKERDLAWQNYERETLRLRQAGYTEKEIKAKGFGRDKKEWVEQYNKTRGIVEKPKDEKNLKTVKGPSFNLPKLPNYAPPKVTTISLPGLTRDIQDGSFGFQLFKQQQKIDKAEQMKAYKQSAARRLAWMNYERETMRLRQAGYSEKEIRAKGFGMSEKQWKERYNAKFGIVENKKKKAQQQVKSSSEIFNVPEMKLSKGDIFDTALAPGGLLESIDVKQLNIIESVSKKLNPWVIVPEMKTAAQSMDFDAKSPNFAANLSKLTDKSSSIEIADEKQLEKDLTPKSITNDITLETQGVKLVSDAQMVSAQEAYKLEQRLFSNAKSVRDIIEGLNVMGDNLDNAAIDLRYSLEELKKNPNGRVINTPPVQKSAGLVFVLPSLGDEYDPLPALA